MFDLDLFRFQHLLQVTTQGDSRKIFDPIRKKWLLLQPEELVRQLMLQFLTTEKGYNKNRVKVEKYLKVNTLSKRCDILVYDAAMMPFLLVECKAPQVSLNDAVFLQMASYNLPLRVPFLMMTNGLVAYCCKVDYETASFSELPEVPSFLP